jgi:hypothetical protein
MPPFFMQPPSWDVQFHADFSPARKAGIASDKDH